MRGAVHPGGRFTLMVTSLFPQPVREGGREGVTEVGSLKSLMVCMPYQVLFNPPFVCLAWEFALA